MCVIFSIIKNKNNLENAIIIKIKLKKKFSENIY